MRQTLAKIRVGNSKGRTFVALAIALAASCVMLPVTAVACSHPAGQAGGISLPWLQGMQNTSGGRDAKTVSASPNGNTSIVGLWHVFFVSGGQPFDEGFDQWHKDGTEILNDTAPPQPANGAGTICLGVFKKTGQRTYKLNHPFWSFDANGNLAGSGVFLEDVTVDVSGNSYQGSFKFDLFDLSGNLIFEAAGDINAERITAD